MSFWLAYGVTRAVSDLVASELSSRPSRDDDYLLPDERARQAACAALEREPELDTSQVSVLVLSGVLSLSGSVPSATMKARAEQLCAGIPGVAKVENVLSVTPKDSV